jgi:hypothetical protein
MPIFAFGQDLVASCRGLLDACCSPFAREACSAALKYCSSRARRLASAVHFEDHKDSSPWLAAQHRAEDQSYETADEAGSGRAQGPGCGGIHQESVLESQQAPGVVAVAAAAAEPVVLA